MVNAIYFFTCILDVSEGLLSKGVMYGIRHSKIEKLQEGVKKIQNMNKKIIKNKYKRATNNINELEQIINEKIGIIDLKVESME